MIHRRHMPELREALPILRVVLRALLALGILTDPTSLRADPGENDLPTPADLPAERAAAGGAGGAEVVAGVPERADPAAVPGWVHPSVAKRELVSRLEAERAASSRAKPRGFGDNLPTRRMPDAIARLARVPEPGPGPLARTPFTAYSERSLDELSRSWFVNEFVEEMERSFHDSSESLLDEDSVLNGSRLFGERWGVRSDLFAERGEIEQMTAEERVILRSSVEAIKETLSQTDAYQFLYRRIQDVEVYLNWSVVHAEQDFYHVVKLYSAAEEEEAASGGGSRRLDSRDVVSKLDSRFRLSNLIEDPDEIFEFRGRVLRHLRFSIFPLSRRLELSTVLYQADDLRLGLTYTEESGSGRMLVAGLTAGF